ncbi:MAG TPA: flagellar export protein FliJ [Thermoanaerobacterales bacterium]|nr:flagellar export protein FliJ [Thermoanaerobacterales bacterium]
MKKFRFKLETPLRVKKITEEICKQKLAEAIIAKSREEERLNHLLQTNSKIISELQSLLSSSIRIKEVSLFNTYIDDLNSRIKSQKNSLDNAIEAYKYSWMSFIEKRKERQVFERIKEKRFKAYIKEMNSEEQKNSDESAATMYIFREGKD